MPHPTDSSSDVLFSAWSDEDPPDQWYVDLGGVRLGPLDRDAVIEMYESGNLRVDDRVQQVGCHDWGYVKQLCSRDTEDSSRGSSFIPDVTPERTSSRDDLSGDEVSSEEAFDISASQLDESETTTKKPTTTKSTRRRSESSSKDRQYYFQCDDQEVGPVPLSTLQELAKEGEIVAETPVRLEDRAVWLTAKSLGIRCPAVIIKPEPATPTIPISSIVAAKASESRKKSGVQARETLGKGLISGGFWLLFAPLYSLASLCRNAKSTKLSLLVTIFATVAVIGFWANHIYRDRMTIITTGKVLLDDSPAVSVVITLSNLTTGESAIGVTDSNGTCQLRSLRGTLSPGRYRVTVSRPKEFEVNDAPPIPKSYISEATSGLDVDFDGRNFEVHLTSNGT